MTIIQQRVATRTTAHFVDLKFAALTKIFMGALGLTRAVHCKITMCFEILAVDEEPVVIRCLLDSGTFERAS
jgi:hypothetical protein